MLDLIKPDKSGKAVVLAHAGPDLDALGSAAFVTHLLRSTGNEVTAGYFGKPKPTAIPLLDPKFWGGQLPISGDPLLDALGRLVGNDRLIVVDTALDERINPRLDIAGTTKAKVIIFDHHQIEENNIAGPNVQNRIDPSAHSTAQLLFEAFKLSNPRNAQLITRQIAEALLMGHYDDTAQFAGLKFGEMSRATRATNFAGWIIDAFQIRLEETVARYYRFDPELIRPVGVLGVNAEIINSPLGDFIFTNFAGLENLDPNIAASSFEYWANNHALKSGAVAALVWYLKEGKLKLSTRASQPIALELVNVFGGGGHAHAAGASVEVDKTMSLPEQIFRLNQAILMSLIEN
jgi:nanoRNase/pAp phosphatase (c-di-AMP/oligoRNAs hydrolase)